MGNRIPEPSVLRELLRYSPETGKLFWRVRDVQWFQGDTKGGRSPEWRCRGWNAKWAGKEAFTCRQSSGYFTGAVLAIPAVAHRIAYSIYYDRQIVGEIDHISGDKSDNRIINLREVDHATNAKNAAIYSNNRSGTPGVMWDDSRKAWAVKINFGGKQRCIGRYKNKSDAVAARKRAEMVHGYHQNHGRQAIGG